MAHQHAPGTSDYRFYISSLARSATAFVAMIRQHWDIENKLHWSLEVTFNEDRGRIRKDHAAENMVAVRHIALNLLRQEHSHRRSLRHKRLLCGLDEHYLLTVLAGATQDNGMMLLANYAASAHRAKCEVDVFARGTSHNQSI
jgi:hypothetical protein